MENKTLNIKKIVNEVLKEHISQKEMINEDLGNLIRKLGASYGDDVAKTFKSLGKKGNYKINLGTKEAKFMTKLGNEVDLSKIEQAVDAGVPINKIIELLPDELKDGTEIKNLLKNVKPKPVNPTPVPNVKDVGAFKQFAQGIGLGFYDWFVNNLKRLDSIYDNFLLPGYYSKFGNLETLQTEFNGLAEEVLVKSQQKKIINNELGRMADILSRVGHMKERQMFILWREWKKVMPKEFVKDLKSWENPEFQKLVSWFESIDPKTKKSSPNVTYSKMEGFRSLIKIGKKNTDTVGEKFTRIMNTVLMADTRTYKELGQNIKIYGFWRSIGKGIAQKFILGFIIFPFYSSLLQTFLDYADKSGVGLGIGDKENIKPELSGVGNTVGNSSDFSSAWKRNFVSKYPIIGKDFLSLLSWSPLLWFAERERYSKLTNKQVVEKVKVTLPKVKKEQDRLQKEVVDSVKTDPSLIEGIEKEWGDLIKRMKKSFTSTTPEVPIKKTTTNNTTPVEKTL